MHHLSCHHWSKFQTKLKTILGDLTKIHPKINVSAATTTLKNLKLKNFRSSVSKTCSVCVPPEQCQSKGSRVQIQKHKKCQELIKILTLILLKSSLQNAIRLEIFPISLIIYLPQMYWECRRRRVALISMRGCSSLVSQYHNTDV